MSFFNIRRTAALWELVLVAGILTLGAVLRFTDIQSRPGFEWDEPVYATIAQHVTESGFPAFQPEADEALTPYLYHPPFDFYLKGWWFALVQASGVGSARILSAIESIVLLVLTYVLVRIIAGRNAAIWALLLVATDGWLVFTNRLNLIENAMMPIGVAGLCLYALACKKDRALLYALAGAVLAFAAVYKHTGICFLLVPVVNVALTRRKIRSHVLMLATATIVILLYVVGMYLTWGNTFFSETLIQIERTFGGISARGLNYGFAEVLQALVNTYWLFFMTLIAMTVIPLMIVIQFYRVARRREPLRQPILLSWSVAALLFLAGIALKAPQYLILGLVPLYAVAGLKLSAFFQNAPRRWLIAGVGLVLALNTTTWVLRFELRDDNALLATSQYVAQHLPSDALIVTEESIHALLPQPYYKLDSLTYKDLSALKPRYLILYTSTTLKPPSTALLAGWMGHSTLVTQFTGFKERIQIYQVRWPSDTF